MFFKTHRGSKGIESLIGAGTRIEGDVFFGGELRLEGSVRGNVCVLPEHSGLLVLGEKGSIDGDVAVPHLVLNGTVNGKVLGSERLELQSSARVSGDVHYRFLSVRRGAIVEGRLAHRASIEPKQEAALKPVLATERKQIFTV